MAIYQYPFMRVSGASFVPHQVERALLWSALDLLQPFECCKFEWDVKLFTHAPTSIVPQTSKTQDNNKENKPVKCNNIGSLKTPQACTNVNSSARKVTPMKLPGKRKGRTLEDGLMDVVVSNIGVLRASQSTGFDKAVARCPYDSIMFIFANVWK
ncbi:hypothetical protein ARMGADRAFT_1040522 [Armillaria gallica]|uniref:Uncharacterized protein n=1 Tax=Armillaria gallica TaxID=47427 RepID=A0A2H3CD63_ARMGA|nr:hypothetical protein ARMGADRAFT_1040522 [Armillaria gallica]